MLVTYILLCYNQENFIGSAIESIINQNYKEIEIIVSDDCSTDKSWNAISNMSQKNNIKITKTKKNIGLIGNINHALTLATGDIIIFMGGDDISEPNRTQITVDYFKKHLNVYGLYSSTIDIDHNGVEIKNSNYGLKYYNRNGDMNINSHLLNDLGMLGCSAAYRACLLEKPLPDLLPSEDKVLTLRALMKGEVGFINKKLVRYRLGTGISNNLNKKNISEYIKIIKSRIRTIDGYISELYISKNINTIKLEKQKKFLISILSILDAKKHTLPKYFFDFENISLRDKIRFLYYRYLTPLK